MGLKSFPDEEKLRFIIGMLIKGKSDRYIQDMLSKTVPYESPPGEKFIYGKIGDRTLYNIRSVYRVSKELLGPLFERVNDPSVQKAKDEHLTEMGSLIECWRNVLVTPTMDQIFERTLLSMREAEKLSLFACLREHIPNQELWITYNRYIKMSEQYLHGVLSLENTTLNDICKWRGVEEVTDIAFHPIFQRVIATSKGIDAYEHKFNETPASTEGTYWMAADGCDVLRAKGTEGLQKRYARYSREMSKSSAVAKIIKRYTKILKLENRLKQYLEDVLHRRDYVFHSCAICPDSLEIGRTGSPPHVTDNTHT